MPDLESGYKAVEALQSLQPGCVVLTLGEKGVLFSEKSTLGEMGVLFPEKSNADQWGDIQHIKAEKVEAVDTTVTLY